MVFSSLTFISVFLTVVFILHQIIPKKAVPLKNGLLILASLVFYSYGEPKYVLLMIASALINYLYALIISYISKKPGKFVLILSVLTNLGILCIFKYSGFIVETVNSLTNSNFSVPMVALPVGISFFTFQAMSYVIDVYNEKVKVQKNPFKVLLFIALFPQLIAGPIVKYRDIEKELYERQASVNDITEGLCRFVFGLSKKVLIANTLGKCADSLLASGEGNLGFVGAWLFAFSYFYQIFFDFSGYSDMAIGLGRMFGFHFPENFKDPYAALGIKDFWRKWHISLSSWFKDYLYIPLGGNRKGKARTCINKIIVFFFTGLWHGASFNFVFWGLYHGFFLLLEEYIPLIRRLPKFILHIYTVLVVMIGFVFFRVDTMTEGFSIIREMFSFTPGPGYLYMRELNPWFITMALAAILFSGPFSWFKEKVLVADKKEIDEPVFDYLKMGVSLLLLCFCMIRLSGSTYNPFIYFKF